MLKSKLKLPVASSTMKCSVTRLCNREARAEVEAAKADGISSSQYAALSRNLDRSRLIWQLSASEKYAERDFAATYLILNVRLRALRV